MNEDQYNELMKANTKETFANAKGLVLGASCNTPFYINIDLYKNREL